MICRVVLEHMCVAVGSARTKTLRPVHHDMAFMLRLRIMSVQSMGQLLGPVKSRPGK